MNQEIKPKSGQAIIDHLGIAVPSLADALDFYERILGLRISGFETIAQEKTNVALLPLGDSRIELPQGVIGPFFNDEYGDVFSAVYMLTGDGATRADLKRQAETLRRSLLLRWRLQVFRRTCPSPTRSRPAMPKRFPT